MANTETREKRMEELTKALKEVCMKPRDDSWTQQQYIDNGVGEITEVVDKMCQLDWLHKFRLKEYEMEIKKRVEEIALEKGHGNRAQYYKGIYMDASKDVQRLPKFQLKVNRGLAWMDAFNKPITVV